MIGSIAAAVGRAYVALLNAPPKNQMCIGSDEAHALRMMLDFCDEQLGKSHEGYYSTRYGWCGHTLKGLLDRYDNQTRK